MEIYVTSNLIIKKKLKTILEKINVYYNILSTIL